MNNPSKNWQKIWKFVQKSVTLQRLFVQKSVIEMKRILYNSLIEWKNDPSRKPLVLEGRPEHEKNDSFCV